MTAIGTPLPAGRAAPQAWAHDGLWNWLTTVDHKPIGRLYLFTSLACRLESADDRRRQVHQHERRALGARQRRERAPCSAGACPSGRARCHSGRPNYDARSASLMRAAAAS
jgi:hypothetical protein